MTVAQTEPHPCENSVFYLLAVEDKDFLTNKSVDWKRENAADEKWSWHTADRGPKKREGGGCGGQGGGGQGRGR